MKPILHICSLMLIIIMLTITTIAASPFIDGPEEAADCDISTLLDRVINAYTEINELRATIRIEIMDPNAAGSFSDYIVGEVLYRKPDILRLTYLEPMEWADYFILIDRKQDTMKTYQPVTDRLFVESLSGAAKSNIGLSLDSLLVPPGEEDVIRVTQMTDVNTQQNHYVIYNKTDQYTDLGLQKFWLDPETYLIKQVHLYDLEGKLLLRGIILKMEIDPNIKDSELFYIPLEAEISYR